MAYLLGINKPQINLIRFWLIIYCCNNYTIVFESRYSKIYFYRRTYLIPTKIKKINQTIDLRKDSKRINLKINVRVAYFHS